MTVPDAVPAVPADESPLEDPTDAARERERLLADAAAQGVDPAEAIEVADKLGQLMPQPLADRQVDRRIATGYTADEAEQILLNDEPDPTSDPDRTPDVANP